jgi:hypothetical protein
VFAAGGHPTQVMGSVADDAAVAVHRPGMTVPGAGESSLREPLRQAIADHAIEVYYQPLIRAATTRD